MHCKVNNRTFSTEGVSEVPGFRKQENTLSSSSACPISNAPSSSGLMDWSFAQKELLQNAGFDITKEIEERTKEFEIKEKQFETRCV